MAAQTVVGAAVQEPSTGAERSNELSVEELGIIWDQAIHILGGNVNVISRWEGEIRFSVVSDRRSVTGDKRQAETIRQTLEDISAVTNLPLRKVDATAASFNDYLLALQQSPRFQLMACESGDVCANFVVVIASVKNMRALAEVIPLRNVYQRVLKEENQATCFFAPFQSASTIKQSLVFVRNDLSDDMTRTCLQEEIYQSFGLFSDYTKSTYFSFNNVVQPKEITPFDRALLKAVYEFEAGAPAFAVVQRLMANLGANTTVR